MANTYIELGTHRSITHSPFDRAKTYRTLVSNFYNESNTTPQSSNFTIDNTNINIPDGTKFCAGDIMYSFSSSLKKGTILGSNWTRNGWGPKLEESYTSLLANVASVEVGSLACTVSSNVSLASQAALYLRISPLEAAQSLLDLSTTGLAPGDVTRSKIRDSAVTTEAFGSNAVNTSDLNNGAITSSKVADSAITSAKIKENAAPGAKIATNAITSDKISSGSVGSSELATNSVNTSEIGNNQVTSAKIGNNQVINSKITNSTILGSKFTANTIGPRELKGLTTGTTGKRILSVGNGSFKWSS